MNPFLAACASFAHDQLNTDVPLNALFKRNLAHNSVTLYGESTSNACTYISFWHKWGLYTQCWGMDEKKKQKYIYVGFVGRGNKRKSRCMCKLLIRACARKGDD